jgi:hypothetical protein|tara:strand:+ start:1102 stop:1731 length:630 start_codon:yes stop_codon:yes gene_type:complete
VTTTTHAELLDALQAHLHEDTTSLPDNQIDEALDFAEARIRKEVRAREMETDSSISLTSGTRTVALPSNFIGHRRLYLSTSPIRQLRFVTPEYYWATWMSSTTGEPEEFTVEADNFLFGPTPGSDYTGQVLFYSLAALTPSVTPDLFTNHPDLYWYGTLVELAPFLGASDSDIIRWESGYQRSKELVLMSNQRDRHPGPLVRRRIGSVV